MIPTRCQPPFAAALLLAALASTASVQAQTASAADNVRVEISGRASSSTLDQPQDSGSRLGLSSLQTPFSVDSASQAELQTRGVTGLADSARAFGSITGALRPGAPGVFSSRGFAENALGMLFDGIRVGGATLTMRNADAFGYERIELLRGAGSVLHGEGAGAGALNFVRRKPRGGALALESLLQLGDGGARRAGGALTGSVAPGWDTVLSAVVQHKDGPAEHSQSRQRQLVAGARLNLARQAALFVELDRLDNRVDDAYWGSPLVGGQPAPGLARKNYNRADDNRYDDGVTWLRAGLLAPLALGRYEGQVYRYDAERDWKNFYAFSSSTVPGRIQARAVENLAYEHRMHGTRHQLGWQSAAQQGLLGVEWQDTDFSSPRSTSTNRPDFDPLDPQPAGFDALALPRADARRAQVQSLAIYAEQRWQLAPQWALLLGGRLNDLDAQIARPSAGVAFGKRFRYGDTRIGLNWDFSPGQTLYFSGASGSEPIESLFILDPSQTAFDLTRYRALEIGSKGQWRGVAGAWAEWTVALYHLSRHDLPAADPDVPGAFVQIGEQSSRGVELGLRAEPRPHWRIEASATRLKARFDTAVNFVGGVGAVAAGNTPPNVPLSLAHVKLQAPLAAAWRLGAQAQWVGARQGNVANTLRLDGYRTLDLWLQWLLPATQRLELRVSNVSDALPVLWASSGFGQTNLIYGEPRRVLLSWSANW
jgi:iron complex outermembrane recepter protein